MGYASADLVARQPVYPGPDLASYSDQREADLFARQPLYPGPDLVAYPWSQRAPAIFVAGGSVVLDVSASGALTIAGLSPTLARALGVSGSDSIAIVGLGPALVQSLAVPGSDALVLVGFAPTLGVPLPWAPAGPWVLPVPANPATLVLGIVSPLAAPSLGWLLALAPVASMEPDSKEPTFQVFGYTQPLVVDNGSWLTVPASPALVVPAPTTTKVEAQGTLTVPAAGFSHEVEA